MLSYRWYLEQKKISRYLLVLLWFALSLLSKPMAVTLPFVLLLIDYWPLRRFCLHTHKVEADPSVGYLRSFIKPVLEKVPLFLLSTISSAITIKAQTEGGAVISSEAIPLWARAANALRSYGYYLYQTICPRSLSIFYPHPETAINMMEVMAAGLVVSIVTILVIRFAKRCPYLVAGWFLYLGMLVPVIGFFKQAGTQGMADRYMYLPSIGLAIMVSWGIPLCQHG